MVLCTHGSGRARWETAQDKVGQYQGTYANNRRISYMPAIFSTSGRIRAEFFRLPSTTARMAIKKI